MGVTGTQTSSANDDIVSSANGMDLSNVTIQDIATIKVDSDNSGASILTMNGSTVLASNTATTIIGGSDDNDDIQVTTGNADFEDVTLNTIGIDLANNLKAPLKMPSGALNRLESGRRDTGIRGTSDGPNGLF